MVQSPRRARSSGPLCFKRLLVHQSTFSKLSPIRFRLSLIARHVSPYRPVTTMSSPLANSRFSKEVSVAISAVLKASLLAKKVQDELVGSGGVQKKDKSPVTGESDLAIACELAFSERLRLMLACTASPCCSHGLIATRR